MYKVIFFRHSSAGNNIDKLSSLVPFPPYLLVNHKKIYVVYNDNLTIYNILNVETSFTLLYIYINSEM